MLATSLAAVFTLTMAAYAEANDSDVRDAIRLLTSEDAAGVQTGLAVLRNRRLAKEDLEAIASLDPARNGNRAEAILTLLVPHPAYLERFISRNPQVTLLWDDPYSWNENAMNQLFDTDNRSLDNVR